MIESNTLSNNNTYQLLISEFALISLIISLVIFSFLVLRSRSNIKTFQSQMLLFIILYLVGEIIENINLNIFSSLPELGSQIHVTAAVFLTALFWSRYYYSEKHDTRMVDEEEEDDDNDNIDEAPNNNNNTNR
jgi:SNF family Na+-dependent transporter